MTAEPEAFLMSRSDRLSPIAPPAIAPARRWQPSGRSDDLDLPSRAAVWTPMRGTVVGAAR